MFENDANSSPSQNDEHSNSSTEYLRLASQACASGDAVLGIHLYLAAFERAQHGEGSAVDEAALEGLKHAWQLACKLKERLAPSSCRASRSTSWRSTAFRVRTWRT